MPKSAPAVDTLGELPTQQLQALDQAEQSFDSLVDIAKGLDLRKKTTLLENLFKHLALEQATLDNPSKAYQAYCRTDINVAEKY